MKSFIKYVCILFLVVFASAVSAETFPSAPYVPVVSVSNLKLDKVSYQKGDTITGTFKLTNKETSDVAGVNYQVSLVGNMDQDGIPGVEYDIGSLTAVKLPAKSEKEIHFSYVLKNSPADQAAGILVSAVMDNGIELSWKSISVKILGGVSFLTPVEAFVQYDNKKFELQQGPTVSSDKDTIFNVSFYNGGTNSYDLHPILNLEDKAFEKVSDFKEVRVPVVKVSPLSTSTLQYTLPVKGLRPGVYLAKFTFVDDKGVSRAPVLYARYIVGGDMVSVMNVTSGTSLPLKEGNALSVDIAYTGKPIDITADSNNPTTTAQIAVEIKNEKGETVMTYKDEKQLGLFGVINIKGNAAVPAESLTADIVVTKGENETLATYKGNIIFSEAYADKKVDSDGQYIVEVNNPAPQSKKVSRMLVIGLIVLLVVLIVVALIIRKKKLAATLTLVVFGLCTYSAQAGFIVVSSMGADYARAPLVTGDLTPDVLYPGESYGVTGSIQSWACNNSYSDIYVVGYVFQNNVLVTKSDRVSAPFDASHGSYSHITRFAGTARAPSKSDTYSYKLDVTSRMYWDGNVYSGRQSYVSGFWPFTVVSNSLNNLAYYCTGGTSTSLTWSPVIPADEYKLVINGNGDTVNKKVTTNAFKFDSKSGEDYIVNLTPCHDGFCGTPSIIKTKCDNNCISSKLICSSSDPYKVFDNCGAVQETCSEGKICSDGACVDKKITDNKTQCNLSASSTSLFDSEGNFLKSCGGGEACFDGYCTAISSLSKDPPTINFRGRLHTTTGSSAWKTADPVIGISLVKGGSLDLDWVITGSFAGMSCKTQNIKSAIGYGGDWSTGQNNQTTDYVITCTNSYGSDSKTIKAVVYQAVEF